MLYIQYRTFKHPVQDIAWTFFLWVSRLSGGREAFAGIRREKPLSQMGVAGHGYYFFP